MCAAKINVDLQEERDRVKFDLTELTNWFYGGAENVKRRKYFENEFFNDRNFFTGIDTSYLSYKEKYEEAIRRQTLLYKKVQELSKGQVNADVYDNEVAKTFFKLQSAIFREGFPAGVHFIVFLPALKRFCTPEQQAKWVPKAEKMEIIGTFAQTELGHGTFIRGLETTATYDQRNRQFVINSPTITAYKWWPGGLGQTANFAIVLAQLYTKQKCHGLHPFIVQLRDLETHKPMKGITIGDIGNKFGANTLNNGFLGFKHVRIPLNQMLMGNAEVLPNGDFVKKKSSVMTYVTMTTVRVGIIQNLIPDLCKAVTIATRYSIVRRQSPIEPDQPEPKILEHVTQQMKIFPAIAKVFAIKAAADNLQCIYNDANEGISNGDLSQLPELHALSCCLKAVCSNEVTKAVEVCRLACGGHGYLNASGIAEIYTNVTAAQTYEGENTVLLLQTARFLVKSFEQAVAGKQLSPSIEYLRTFLARNGERENFENSVEGILRALEFTAAGFIARASKHVAERMEICSLEQSFNQTGIELTQAAELHCRVFMLKSFIKDFEEILRNFTPALTEIFRNLIELYSVDLALRFMGNLLQFIEINSSDIEKLQSRLETALATIRPNAIGIVDSFDIHDNILGSTLGAFDGNVYERLLEAAKSSPLNQEDVNKSFEMYLKPFMKSNL